MKKLFLLLLAGLINLPYGKCQLPPGTTNSTLTNTIGTQYLPFSYSFSQRDNIRAGSYSVNYFNGQPNISIPLFTIKEGDIELPITLSYNAEGRKVGENSGFVGFGWQISLGGSLTKTIKDKSDGYYPFFCPSLDTFDFSDGKISDFYTQLDMDHENNDNEYDEYSYSFPGGSGTFVKRNRPWHTPQYDYVLVPYKPYKISGSDPAWDIYDEKGTRFRFGQSIDGTQYGGTPNNYNANYRLALADIVSGQNPNKKISFIYGGAQPHYYERNKYLSGRYIYEDVFDYLNDYYSCDSWHIGVNADLEANLSLSKFQDYIPYPYVIGSSSGLQGGYFEDFTSSTQEYSFNFTGTGGTNEDNLLPLPTEIHFSEGYLKFVFNSSNNKMIDHIEVYNLNNELIKKISFDIGQFLPTDTIYKSLKGVKFQTAAGTTIAEYKLDYNILDWTANYGAFPNSNDATAIDYWGYYNGKLTNANLIPRFTQMYPYDSFMLYLYPVSPWKATPGLADRKPDINYLKAYTLKKITYPEGGYTSFDYEQHIAYNSTTPWSIDTGSGLRIKSINNYTADNSLANRKRFEYPEGRMDVKIEQELFCFSKKMYLVHGWAYPSGGWNNIEDPYRRSTFTPFASVDLAPKGSPVVYPQVKEYTSATYTDLAPTTYTFDYEPTTYGTYNSSHSYNMAPGVNALATRFIAAEKPWSSGNLLSKQDANTQTEYEYEEVLHDTARDIIQNRFIIPQFGTCSPVNYGSNDYFDIQRWGYGYDAEIVFDIANHYNIAGEKRIKNETQTYIGQNNHNLVTKTHYEYSSNFYDQITQITTSTSKGDSIRISKQYPWNTTSTNPVYATMVSKNMISQEIQTDKTLNNSPVSSAKTDYKDWGNNIILPEKVWQKEANGNWIEKLRFDLRDAKGNPLQTTEDAINTTAYTYDYNQQYVNSATTNATFNEVAHSSFEGSYSSSGDVNLGNWNISTISAITNAEAFTGTHSLNLSLSNGTWSTYNPQQGKKYIISFWKKGSGTFGCGNGSAITVNTGSTVNGWTYCEGTFIGDNSNNIGFWSGGGTLYIDELRVYPANAQMETTTYKPLVGITSKCDARNMVTYFEYDDFGRPTITRDMNGKILKKLTYATQQPE